MSTNQRAKIASLKAEADMLHRTEEAELKAQMLTIQGKIAKAEAKAQVYEEDEKHFASLTEAVRKDQIEIYDQAASAHQKVSLKTPLTETSRDVTTIELNTLRSFSETREAAPLGGACSPARYTRCHLRRPTRVPLF